MGKQWKQWETLFSWAPKLLQMVTAALKSSSDACSLEVQPRQHIKKQGYYFADKDPSSQSCGFSISYVRMWELDHKESWTAKNWYLWTVMLEKTLESSLDCKEDYQILKEISPEYSLKGLMLKLKLQYLDYLMQRANSLGKNWFWSRLKAGGEGDDRGQDAWMASQTQWTWVWANSGSWWWTWKPGVPQSMRFQRVGYNWVTEQLNWTDVVPCKVLTVVSWSTYRFLRRQTRWSGISSSLRISHCFLWSKQSKALA